MTLTLSRVTPTDEGQYTCHLETQKSTTHSNTVTISIVKLNQPRIVLTSPDGGLARFAERSEITRGHSFIITCSISPQYPGGVFHLTFSGSNIDTKPAVNHSASFLFPVAEFRHQGNYSCVYQVEVASHNLSSPSSMPVTVIIKLKLNQPHIVLTSPDGGLARFAERSEITRGHSFIITCSISPQYPGGIFHLTFSGSNIDTKPAVNHSASFLFPVAEFKHQGIYSCVYQVEDAAQNFSSSSALPVTVIIQSPSLLMVCLVAASSLLLFLVILAVVCVVYRRRRGARQLEAHIQTPMAVTLRNHYVDSDEEEEEEEEERDYVNVDPAATKEKQWKLAGADEEESDEDHDYEEAQDDYVTLS
ncbi:uncharacterized protein LOC115363035 [Myripristis murdjan]|uniref:uncharacterized protein LOC115363035 n=1 Tax=Myripristis murdjan TaxID=586833 RepID=UPI00117607EB|nr:uncharacterized protein LOC115363035 [Myripristis murdjan]